MISVYLPGDSQGGLLAQAHALGRGCADDSLIPTCGEFLAVFFPSHGMIFKYL